MWALMISPLLLVIVLFALSWRTGLLGLGIVIGTAAVYFGAVFFWGIHGNYALHAKTKN